MLHRTCPNCDQPFDTDLEDKRYCTKTCKEKAKSKRANARRKQPSKRCKSCGQIKPSAKGDYCSKPECRKVAYWEPKGGEAARKKHELELQQQALKRQTSGPVHGPKPLCRNCGEPLDSIHHRYCSKPECRVAYRREYKRRNRDKIRATRKDQKMKRRDAFVEHVDINAIYKRDRWTCQLCGKRVNKNLNYPHPLSASLDHVIPISKGGRHMPANVQLAHWRCNVSKGALGGGEQLAIL